MNVGQVLETHLGWAAKGLGFKIGGMLQRHSEARSAVADLRAFLDQVYNTSGRREDLAGFSDADILDLARHLVEGVPLATPVFDGATEDEIRAMFRWRTCRSPGRPPCTTGAPVTPSSAR